MTQQTARCCCCCCCPCYAYTDMSRVRAHTHRHTHRHTQAYTPTLTHRHRLAQTHRQVNAHSDTCTQPLLCALWRHRSNLSQTHKHRRRETAVTQRRTKRTSPLLCFGAVQHVSVWRCKADMVNLCLLCSVSVLHDEVSFSRMR